MEDWSRTPTGQRWIEHVLDDMAPKMEQSAIVMALVPGDLQKTGADVKFWVELGAMICYDKPILTVAFSDNDIPPKLRHVSDEIVVIPQGADPEASDELQAAMKRMMERIDAEEK